MGMSKGDLSFTSQAATLHSHREGEIQEKIPVSKFLAPFLSYKIPTIEVALVESKLGHYFHFDVTNIPPFILPFDIDQIVEWISSKGLTTKGIYPELLLSIH